MKRVNYLVLDTLGSCGAYGMKVWGEMEKIESLLRVAVHAPPASLTLSHCVIVLQQSGCGLLAVVETMTMMMLKVHQWILHLLGATTSKSK
jgi:hypothetical protein